jgi:tRNA (guanosine-2'-O-)-methyltransferase
MDLRGYDLVTRRQLLNFLLEYITENKRQKFEAAIHERTRHITVVLEDLYQSHNASAVLRSCDCLGIQDVHIIENRNKYEVNRDVALGATKWLDINTYNGQQDNSKPTIDLLKNKGYKVYATTPHKEDVDMQDLKVDSKIALVFGTELEGLSDIALREADGFVKIPMYGFTESFNISVSAAIMLSHLTDKIRKENINWQLSEEEQIDVQLDWARKVINRSDSFIRYFLGSL